MCQMAYQIVKSEYLESDDGQYRQLELCMLGSDAIVSLELEPSNQR